MKRRGKDRIGVRARGLVAVAPLTRAKPLFFGQKLNFSGRSQHPKMKNIFLYLNEKNVIHSVLRDSAEMMKSGILRIVIGVCRAKYCKLV